MPLFYALVLLKITLFLNACDGVWNNPYSSARSEKNALYSAFSERPKHLDPAKSYSSNEWIFVQSVYDSPLQYHYLKRPYTLVLNVVGKMPSIIFYNKHQQILPPNSTQTIAYSDYIIDILPNTFYQPHQAFVKENLSLSADKMAQIYQLSDIEKTATRELVARDFVHQIKRLAHPGLHSPVLSVMKDYIMEMGNFSQRLLKDYQKGKFLDLSQYNFVGAKVLSKYQYRIRIKGHQPQFSYWLAMPFFTAIPPEADVFYAQAGFLEKNISLDWYPVGTGAFYLTVNNPNKEMVLEKNPNFRKQTYPHSGSQEDEAKGLLVDAGKALPLVDKVYFSLETESIPYWHKFLQGYYDKVNVNSDYFDQAITIAKDGVKTVSKEMADKDIRLMEGEGTTIYYGAFNFSDELVGTNNERGHLLRQAIAIAVDNKTYIDIFLNGQAQIAHHPVPSGFFGFDPNKNSQLYELDHQQPKKSLNFAKQLLQKAGYKNGIDSQTGKPLTLIFNTSDTGPSAQARLGWIKKQFDQLGINLIVDATSYSTFLDKIDKGQVQLFEAGWGADYPDAENFLFLFYSKNSAIKYGGDNNSNYNNPEFDALFEQMKNLENTKVRQDMILAMIKIWQKDTPWAWAYTPSSSALVHGWVSNVKPNAMARNTLKYQRTNVAKRLAYQQQHNQANLLPLLVIILLFVVLVVLFMKRRP